MSDPATPVRIVIAEDDDNARALLVEVLASLGHSLVAEAACGTDAVAQARTHRPDAVLLDVHMPDASGVEAAKTIASELPGTAVVLFTGDHSLTLSEPVRLRRHDGDAELFIPQGDDGLVYGLASLEARADPSARLVSSMAGRYRTGLVMGNMRVRECRSFS